MFGINYFTIPDYLVVAATLLFSLGVGIYHSLVGNKTNEDLLVGGRSMGSIPIAISVSLSKCPKTVTPLFTNCWFNPLLR